jgi:hypothetical protein
MTLAGTIAKEKPHRERRATPREKSHTAREKPHRERKARQKSQTKKDRRVGGNAAVSLRRLRQGGNEAACL